MGGAGQTESALKRGQPTIGLPAGGILVEQPTVFVGGGGKVLTSLQRAGQAEARFGIVRGEREGFAEGFLGIRILLGVEVGVSESAAHDGVVGMFASGACEEDGGLPVAIFGGVEATETILGGGRIGVQEVG